MTGMLFPAPLSPTRATTSPAAYDKTSDGVQKRGFDANVFLWDLIRLKSGLPYIIEEKKMWKNQGKPREDDLHSCWIDPTSSCKRLREGISKLKLLAS